MTNRPNRLSLTRILLMVCLLVLALGALPAGFMLVTSPDGSSLGFSSTWLSGSPFPDYTVPGIVLLALFGVGSLVVTYGLVAQPRWAWTELVTRRVNMHWALAAASLLGIGLMIWIAVQVLLIPVSFLQPTLFGLGVAILVLALRISSQSRSAPTS